MSKTDKRATVRETCGKCGGTGVIEWGVPVSTRVNGVEVGRYCFACNGHGHKDILVSSVRARERRREKARLEANAAMESAREKREARRETFTNENADVVEFLTTNAARGDWFDTIRQEFDCSGEIVPGALKVIRRIMAEKAREIEVPEGRYEFEGVIRSWKTVETDWGTATKITVRVTPFVRGEKVFDGEFTVYGTIPRGVMSKLDDAFETWCSIVEPEQSEGVYVLDWAREYEELVRMKATVKRSESFGFFSRGVVV